jgi:oxygen-independent coproporphyrinogen-3 oxidase
LFTFTSLPPLSLYVHIPWCVRKCPYCDFNSHAAAETLPETDYIEALTADLEQELPGIWGRTVHSIFFGGGTPSLLSVAGLDDLLTAIRTRLPLAPEAEITLEANPGTVEREKFTGFRQAGINRLSLGVQSFHDASLARLGRIHDSADAERAFVAARDAGFTNINVDLMYGLPGQDLAMALADLETALTLAPEHLSHYQLTLEPNTLFHHDPPPLPDDDTLWDMQTACQQRLAAAGYEHYEVSAYTRAGHHCLHNLNYWQFGDYVGIGAGAHGKITDAQQQHIRRTTKPRQPRAYIDATRDQSRNGFATGNNTLGNSHIVTRSEVGLEYLMNALRLRDGFPLLQFQQRTGQTIALIDKPLQLAEQRGLIERDLQTIRTTELGFRHLDELLTLFM